MNLPEDILVDILVRLPVKTLVRFRCVSKSWRSLISHPTLVRTHLARSIKTHATLGTASSILLSRNSDNLLSLQHNETDHQGFAVAEELELDLIKSSPYLVKSHCDGLLCLVILKLGKGILVLYNPSIREHRELPIPPNFCTLKEVLGIGYDPTTDDYKIVRYPSGYRMFNIPRPEIFTLRSNSWRALPDEHRPPHYIVNHKSQATNFNGGIYWFCEVRDGDIDLLQSEILRFDIVQETFSVVPGVPDVSIYCMKRLGLLRDSLCAVHSRMTHFHIWTTKDDKDWTKLFTIPTLPGPNAHIYTLLCYTHTGDLVISVRRKGFVIHDEETNTIRPLPVRMAVPMRRFVETVYCESLVSPFFGYNCN